VEKRKGQNSIIFVATLGVYLGLMLSGATPQAIAQQRAAMTRNFDIHDEIEFKDDLDDTSDTGLAIDKLAISLVDLYAVISDASAKDAGGVDQGCYDFAQFLTLYSRGGSLSVFPGELNPGTHLHLGRTSAPLGHIYDAFLFRSNEPNNKFRLDLKLTQTDFTFGVTISKRSPEVAAYLSGVYNDSLSKRRQLETVALKSLVYDGTKISVNGEKISVVTHLPRASLDELLAKSAK
jgi:hypothetical protein